MNILLVTPDGKHFPMQNLGSVEAALERIMKPIGDLYFIGDDPDRTVYEWVDGNVVPMDDGPWSLIRVLSTGKMTLSRECRLAGNERMWTKLDYDAEDYILYKQLENALTERYPEDIVFVLDGHEFNNYSLLDHIYGMMFGDRRPGEWLDPHDVGDNEALKERYPYEEDMDHVWYKNRVVDTPGNALDKLTQSESLEELKEHLEQIHSDETFDMVEQYAKETTPSRESLADALPVFGGEFPDFDPMCAEESGKKEAPPVWSWSDDEVLMGDYGKWKIVSRDDFLCGNVGDDDDDEEDES